MRRDAQNPRFRLASAKPIAAAWFRPKISPMDFTLSDEQRAFQETARDFARDEWLPLMDAAGIPSGGIRTVGEVCESELLKSRDMIAEMPHPGKGVGVVKNIKNPMHLSDTPLDTYAAPPRLGEHTREILTGLLGYSASEVEELARSETI